MNYTRMTKSKAKTKTGRSEEIVIHLSRNKDGYEIVYDARGLRARAFQGRDPIVGAKGAVTRTIAREGERTWTALVDWSRAIDRMASEIVETYMPLSGGLIKVEDEIVYITAARLNSVVRGILSESVRDLFGEWSGWKEAEARYRLAIGRDNKFGSTIVKFDIIRQRIKKRVKKHVRDHAWYIRASAICVKNSPRVGRKKSTPFPRVWGVFRIVCGSFRDRLPASDVITVTYAMITKRRSGGGA